MFLFPRRELQDRCAGFPVPRIFPPFATGTSWSKVYASGALWCAVQLIGLPHIQHGWFSRRAFRFSACAMSLYALLFRFTGAHLPRIRKATSLGGSQVHGTYLNKTYHA